MRLGGKAAEDLTETLTRAGREVLGLTRGASPGDMFELVPPKELAKGLQDGTLRMATPRRGDASVLVKNVEDGRIAGKADLQNMKPTPAELIGPAAWQAMALATQQHYLAEIATKLEGIQHGVEEVLARLDDDRVGALNGISDTAAVAQTAARHGNRLSETRLLEVRHGAMKAKELWYQTALTAQRQLDQYGTGESAPDEVQQTFAILTHATQVLMQCSEALLAIPYDDASALETAVSEEQDRLQPILPEYLKLCEGLVAASEDWRQQHEDYQARLPTNTVQRWLHLNMRIERAEGEVRVSVPVKPAQKPLPPAQVEKLRELTGYAEEAQVRLLAEVNADGSVLVGPVMTDVEATQTD